MEFKRPEQLRDIADLRPTLPAMTREERLARWADLLDRQAGRRLKTLDEIEFVPVDKRAALRADDSPLSIAYADPVLREEGLASDRLGDAMAFFNISEHEAHRVLCSCMHGRTVDAGRAAQCVRAISNGRRELVASTAVAVALFGVPLLLYLF